MPTNRVTVTNAVQLQQALNNAAVQNISMIDIDADIINVTSPLLIPTFLFAQTKHLIIRGNGCTIRPLISGAGAPTHLMKVTDPLNETQAQGMLINRFTIEDINFDGRFSNLTALELTATRQSSVTNCKFLNCSFGLKLMYAPFTRVIQCFSAGISGIAFDVNKYIDPIGIIPSNTFGSPFTRIENCVIENESGTYAAINILASGNCIVSQIFSTGKRPLYHLYFDSNGYLNANSIFIDNIQVGNAATIAAIKLDMYGGFAKISGVVNNFDQVLIEANSQLTNPQTTLPRVFLEHYPVITPLTKFKTGGACLNGNVIWSFFDVDDGRNLFLPSRWVNGNVPIYRKSEYFDNSNEIVTNSMKVNNNVISA